MSDTLPARATTRAWVLTGKRAVDVVPNHTDTARAILDALIADRTVYAWVEQSTNTRGVRYSLFAKCEGRWCAAATPEDTRSIVESRIDGSGHDAKGVRVNKPIPERVIKLLLGRRDRQGASGRQLRVVSAISTRPIFDRSLSPPWCAGYHEEAQIMVDLDAVGDQCLEVAVVQRYDHEDAARAVQLLHRVAEGARWTEASRAAWVASVVAATTRLLWARDDLPASGHAAPGLVISAGAEGSGTGKTTLAKVLARIAGGAIGYTDPHDGAELVRTLGPIVALKMPVIHVKEASVISQDWMDLLTGGSMLWRKVRTSVIADDPMRSLVCFEGTLIKFGDLAQARRRVVIARLDGKADPDGARVRDGQSPEEFVASNEAKLWLACHTIVIAYALAGYPKVECLPALESFECWDLVRRAVVWAGGADALASRDAADLDARDDSMTDGDDLIDAVREGLLRNPGKREGITWREMGGKQTGHANAKAFGRAVERARWGAVRVVGGKAHPHHPKLYRLEIREPDGTWANAPDVEPPVNVAAAVAGGLALLAEHAGAN